VRGTSTADEGIAHVPYPGRVCQFHSWSWLQMGPTALPTAIRDGRVRHSRRDHVAVPELAENCARAWGHPRPRDMSENGLALDCHWAHRCVAVQELARNFNITMHFVPRGVTNMLLPLDLAAFPALKSECRVQGRFESSQREDKGTTTCLRSWCWRGSWCQGRRFGEARNAMSRLVGVCPMKRDGDCRA
jgi:hypothetical protein